VNDKALGVLFAAGCFCFVAYFEWYGHLTHAPRRPVLFTVVAAAAVIFAGWRIWSIRGRVRQLKLGRDGERSVGQLLEQLRENGAQVFHDVPGEGFNLDHVVISTHGIYANFRDTKGVAAARVCPVLRDELCINATPIEL
jgi:nuclease-like protein